MRFFNIGTFIGKLWHKDNCLFTFVLISNVCWTSILRDKISTRINHVIFCFFSAFHKELYRSLAHHFTFKKVHRSLINAHAFRNSYPALTLFKLFIDRPNIFLLPFFCMFGWTTSLPKASPFIFWANCHRMLLSLAELLCCIVFSLCIHGNSHHERATCVLMIL